MKKITFRTEKCDSVYELTATIGTDLKPINPVLNFYDILGDYIGTWTNSEVLINIVYPALKNGNTIKDNTFILNLKDYCIIYLEDYNEVINIFDQAIKEGFFETI